MTSPTTYHKFAAFDGLEMLAAEYYHQPFPWHAHDTYNVSLITGGTEAIQLPTATLYAPGGSISITHPQEVHANPVLHAPGCSFYTFYVSPAVMTHLAGGRAVHFPERVIGNAPLFARFWQLARYPSPDFNQPFGAALCDLIRHYGAPGPTPPAPANGELITALKASLTAYLHAPAPLAQLARQHGLDKFKLLRYFKQHTGLTPQGFVLMQRVEAAKQLLQQGSPLAETALAVGFYDQAHFSRFFKSFVGVSPGRYPGLAPPPLPGL